MVLQVIGTFPSSTVLISHGRQPFRKVTCMQIYAQLRQHGGVPVEHIWTGHCLPRVTNKRPSHCLPEWQINHTILQDSSDPTILTTNHRSVFYIAFRQGSKLIGLHGARLGPKDLLFLNSNALSSGSYTDGDRRWPHHWFLPLHHNMSWLFNSKKHVGILHWWDPGKEEEKSQDNSI